MHPPKNYAYCLFNVEVWGTRLPDNNAYNSAKSILFYGENNFVLPTLKKIRDKYQVVFPPHSRIYFLRLF